MGIHRSLLLGLLLCLLAAAPADAAMTGSTITSPANGSELFFNGDNGSGNVTVTGTVTGSATKGDLVCYTVGDTKATTVVNGIPISASGTFNVGASLLPIAGFACRLAVVPQGTRPLANGSADPAASFAGPAVSVSDQFSHSAAGNLFGYYILTGTLPWSFAFGSAGECPVRSSYATDPSSLGSYTLFGLDGGTVGGACLPRFNTVDPDKATRSTLQIDGLNAYLPGAIATAVPVVPPNPPKPETALASQPGFIPITYSAQFNAAHDTVTITENDAAMICDPPATYPPTTLTCPSLHDSGVHLTQTTTLLPGGQVARVTQQFTSVDGRAHSIDALFNQSASAQPGSGGSPGFEFPGQTSFATHATPDSFAQFPAGPSSIIAISNANGLLPATTNPIGAITYNRPPQSADFITACGTLTATLLMDYADSLPAGASVTYDWSFSQASSSATLATLEQIERDRFGNPTVSIRNPPMHHVTTKGQVRVQGSVSDSVGISALNVNGQGVIVRPGGIWGVTVNLRPGPNTITATATNVAGNTGTATVAVTYNLPPCKVPRLHNKTLSKAKHLLKNAGCKTGKVKRVHSRKIRKGHVISTRPGAGAKRRNGTKVGLTVSSGKPTKKRRH